MIQRENVQTNISLAYHSMGKFDDALAVIRQIKLPQADKQLEFLVHCIYVDCYISKGDLSGAGIWFQRTMDFFNKTKFSRTFSQIINDFISLARAEIGLMYNDLSGFNGTAISYLNTRKNRVAAAEHDLIFAKYAIARNEIQNAVFIFTFRYR